MRDRSEDDARLDALSDKMSDFVDGWALEDVSRVCASIAAAAVAMNYRTTQKREQALQQLHEFMHECMQRMAVHMHDGNNWKH